MGKSNRSQRASRYDQLGESEREELLRGTSELVLTGRLRSFKGAARLTPFFKAQLKLFELDVSKSPDSAALVDAFVLRCNERGLDSKRAFEAVRGQIRNGLLKYLVFAGLLEKPILSWPTTFGQQFVDWLNGRGLSPNTNRKHYGTAVSLLAYMAEMPGLRDLLPEFDAFPNNAFEGAHRSAVVTESLGLSVLVKIIICARSDFLLSVERVNYANKLFESGRKPSPLGFGAARWRNLDDVLLWLWEKFPDKCLPPFSTIKEMDREVSNAISDFHGGWRNVAVYFHPTAEALIAPMILFYIYSHMNTEPLRALKTSDVRLFDGFGGERLRVIVRIDKQRGAPYDRSFPVDAQDPASPSSVLEFVQRWTNAIRTLAPSHDSIFLHLNMYNKPKAFLTAKNEGASADSSWRHHLRNFVERHSLPQFSISELRQTAIDYVWLITDGDIRAILSVKGGTSEAVIRQHYKSDSQKQRQRVVIAQLQSNRERDAATLGKTSHRGTPKKADISAATPGWNCIDPYQSPIPGEVVDRLCQAFGMCPGCPHGSPQLDSEYSLARSLQLRQLFKEGPSRLGLNRWKRYQTAATALETVWLPLFHDEVWEKAKFLQLVAIGELE